MTNQLVEFIRSVMDMMIRNYSYESVFRYLRSGLSDVTPEETDQLENYVLAAGIRGHKMYRETFVRRPKLDREDRMLRYNELREKFLQETEELHEGLHERMGTARRKSEALYRFLVKTRCQEKIKAEQEQFKAGKDLLSEREYSQIWAYVMGLLDKIVEVLGDEPMKLEDFRDVLESGFQEGRVGLIPPGEDQVTVGDIRRTRLGRIRVLFFVGVNEGIIPQPLAAGGVLSETDREELQKKNIELSPTAREEIYQQRFYLYLSMTKPQDLLYLSFSRTSGGGKPQMPSYLIGVVKKMFPDLEIRNLDADHPAGERLETPEGRKSLLFEGLSGMRYADGVLTAAGSRSIYAASLAGGQGVCCVTDCPDLTIDEEQGLLRIGDAEFARGDYISISGFNGRVYDGRLTVQPPYDWDAFGKIMSWADSFRHLRVRVNADTPEDAALALRLGAEGVGLCRSERMFYNEERAAVMRRAVLAPSPAVRQEMVQKMMEFQIRDFTEIFRIMCTRPVTIRLLDPSLSVFLIGAEDDFRTMASEWGISEEEVRERASSFYEVNQTMGERGVRVGIEYPDILSMQAEAIFRAAAAVSRELEKEPDPEILVPFVVSGRELAQVKKLIRDAASRVREEEERTVEYRLGSMIEVPRAALTAGEIAEEAEFFSFGTNDLTQLVMGLSREGSGHIVRKYREQKILDRDPFLTLDQEGVGRLMMYAVEAGRKTRPNLKAGICGTHAGDPDSIDFCSRIGLNYVSCQARQVPVARLAAAQADIRAEGDRDE